MFAFFGAHTMLWFYRSLKVVRERARRNGRATAGEALMATRPDYPFRRPRSTSAPRARYYLRFDRIDRVMHAFLMITFIGCAITGMPLLVADHEWAQAFARLLGGFQSGALIHRDLRGRHDRRVRRSRRARVRRHRAHRQVARAGLEPELDGAAI